MKRNCKNCTVNSTGDTIETCTRPCYIRYERKRKDRICDLTNKIAKYTELLEDIKRLCNFNYTMSNTNLLAKEIAKMINEVLNENK